MFICPIISYYFVLWESQKLCICLIPYLEGKLTLSMCAANVSQDISTAKKQEGHILKQRTVLPGKRQLVTLHQCAYINTSWPYLSHFVKDWWKLPWLRAPLGPAVGNHVEQNTAFLTCILEIGDWSVAWYRLPPPLLVCGVRNGSSPCLRDQLQRLVSSTEFPCVIRKHSLFPIP